MKKIITISGKAEAGKTTSANILKDFFEKHGQRVLILNYGDVVKFVAEKYCNWNGVKDEQGRSLLQKIGTERGRKLINENIWVDFIIYVIQMLKDDYDYFIVGDCRFKNEIERYYHFGLLPFSILIERTNHKSILTEEQLKHSSETSLDGYQEFNYIIENNSSFYAFAEKIKKIAQQLL